MTTASAVPLEATMEKVEWVVEDLYGIFDYLDDEGADKELVEAVLSAIAAVERISTYV
jgi:hypothetical protein